MISLMLTWWQSAWSHHQCRSHLDQCQCNSSICQGILALLFNTFNTYCSWCRMCPLLFFRHNVWCSCCSQSAVTAIWSHLEWAVQISTVEALKWLTYWVGLAGISIHSSIWYALKSSSHIGLEGWQQAYLLCIYQDWILVGFTLVCISCLLIVHLIFLVSPRNTPVSIKTWLPWAVRSPSLDVKTSVFNTTLLLKLLLLLRSAISNYITAVTYMYTHSWQHHIIALLSFSSAVDTLISGLLCYYLWMSWTEVCRYALIWLYWDLYRIECSCWQVKWYHRKAHHNDNH